MSISQWVGAAMLMAVVAVVFGFWLRREGWRMVLSVLGFVGFMLIAFWLLIGSPRV